MLFETISDGLLNLGYTHAWKATRIGICLISVETTSRLYPLTLSFNALPALNDATVAAATFIASPVLGFLAVLSALFFVLKVPKPISEISSPFGNASVIASAVALSAFAASAFDKPDFASYSSYQFLLFHNVWWTILESTLYS